MKDPLAAYFDAVKEAPVPARLMAETPPEAFARRLFANLAGATAALALALAVAALPAPPDVASASRAAHALTIRVAVRTEDER